MAVLNIAPYCAAISAGKALLLLVGVFVLAAEEAAAMPVVEPVVAVGADGLIARNAAEFPVDM